MRPTALTKGGRHAQRCCRGCASVPEEEQDGCVRERWTRRGNQPTEATNGSDRHCHLSAQKEPHQFKTDRTQLTPCSKRTSYRLQTNTAI